MRNAACVTDDTTPKDPFAADEEDVAIHIVDGRTTPLVVSIDDEGTPTLYTTLNPMVVADMLITVASGVLRGVIQPSNMPEGDQLRQMVIETAHRHGFSEPAINELLKQIEDPEFDPKRINHVFTEVAEWDEARNQS